MKTHESVLIPLSILCAWLDKSKDYKTHYQRRVTKKEPNPSFCLVNLLMMQGPLKELPESLELRPTMSTDMLPEEVELEGFICLEGAQPRLPLEGVPVLESDAWLLRGMKVKRLFQNSVLSKPPMEEEVVKEDEVVKKKKGPNKVASTHKVKQPTHKTTQPPHKVNKPIHKANNQPIHKTIQPTHKPLKHKTATIHPTHHNAPPHQQPPL